MPLMVDFTEKDHADWQLRHQRYVVDNHPLRDTSKETFFDAMMSEEADLAKHGFLSPEALKLLGE